MTATDRKNWEIRNIWIAEENGNSMDYCLKGMTEAEIRKYMRQITIPGSAKRVIAAEVTSRGFYATLIEATDEYGEKDHTFKRRIRKSQLMAH